MGCCGCRCTPTARNKILGEFMWVSCMRVHPTEGGASLGGEESHFYWAEEGATFNLEGLGGISCSEKDDD